MGKTSLKYRFYFKGISLLLSFLLLAQNIAWANPDGMNLSAQSIFTHNIRNFGLAKYYTSCVDKVFPDLGTIPGNIHVSAGKDRIPVTMLFPKANELKQTFSLDNNLERHINTI